MSDQDDTSGHRFVDDELLGILGALNDAAFAGQLARSEACCSGIGKLFADALGRGLDVSPFTEIADLLPQVAPGLR
jgi:hypothetical protein